MTERDTRLYAQLGFSAQGDLEEGIGQVCQAVRLPGEEFKQAARDYNDSLCKPPGSLGRLEDIYERLYGIFEGRIPVFKKCVVVYAGDNGVVAENISRNPVATTVKVCHNILQGGSGLSQIAGFYGVEVFLEDIAVREDILGHTDHKVLYGTGNMRLGPAMTREEAARCLWMGMETAGRLIKEGYNLIGAGEMGVGNTTTSAAVISCLTGALPEAATGFGSGITEADWQNKVNVVADAILVNRPYTDILDVLSKLAGGDILAMAGTYLKCAQMGIPFVTDGVIAMAALISAASFNQAVLHYGFASHRSTEPGAVIVEKLLSLQPVLDLEMRLGEGSGCPIAMDIMELAVHTLTHMATFQAVSVNKNDYIDIRTTT